MAQHLVPTPTVSTLTGLSTAKLREWTSRRALIPADVPPQGKGSPAQFGWQTVLVLRVAVVLRQRFQVELQAHKASFAELRSMIQAASFPSLWGCKAALDAGNTWTLSPVGAPLMADAMVLCLDPHLEAIRDGFSLPGKVISPLQGDLFSLPNLHGEARMSQEFTAESANRRSA